MKISLYLMNHLLVTAYKIMGFVVLGAILTGTASYIGVQLFYMVSRSWVTPVIVSAHDERAVRAQQLMTQEQAERDKMHNELLQLHTQVEDVRQRLALEEAFQAGFSQAIAADIAQRRASWQRLQTLAHKHDEVKTLLGAVDMAAAARSTDTARHLLQARVIDEADFLQRNMQVTRMAQNHLALTESRISLDDRVEALRRSLDALQGQGIHDRPTYDVLIMRREYERSRLEAERAHNVVEVLQQRMASLSEGIARHDALLKSLADSPFLRAVSHHATLAFVPYRNTRGLTPGQAIYGCRLGLLWCTQVGSVGAVIDGEVTGRHPVNHDELRGVMIDLQMEETWAQRPVLYLRRAPLFT